MTKEEFMKYAIKSFHGYNCQVYKDGNIFIKEMTLSISDLEDMLQAYKTL